MATAIATAMATKAEPVTTPADAAAKAAKSILPSSPRSITPDRSASTPASAHRMSGVATRSVEARSAPTTVSSTGRLRRGSRAASRAAQPHDEARERRGEHVRHRPREQHDEALHHHHHVAAESRQLESHLRAALVEGPEEQAREDDAHG